MAMQTFAGDPGAFARFDLHRVPSPCFVVDEVRVEANLRVFGRCAKRVPGATVLCALKAFSMWELAPLGQPLPVGRLARLACGKHGSGASITAALSRRSRRATNLMRMAEIAALSDHIIFNTAPAAKDRFSGRCCKRRAARDPCRPALSTPACPWGMTRNMTPPPPALALARRWSRFDAAALGGVDGLHMHTLCEQDLSPLLAIWEHIAPRILELAPASSNGSISAAAITLPARDYDRDGLVDFLIRVREETGLHCYLEPGEAVALDAGILVGEVAGRCRK